MTLSALESRMSELHHLEKIEGCGLYNDIETNADNV